MNRLKKFWFIRAACLLVFISADKLSAQNAADKENIKLVFRNDSIERRINLDGDNWHTTWAGDGNQYVLQCDGQGYNTRLWRLSGPPSDFKFEVVEEHPGPKEKPKERYYGFGILGVDKSIYHYFSTPDKWYTNPPWKFIGAKLVYSPDMGKTWHNQDGTTPIVFEETRKRNKDNMVFFNEPGESFSLLTMLQMGKGYEDNKDGYIYVYSPNGIIEGTMNQLVMFRAPKDKIRQRKSYEYFVSSKPDGSAVWSKNISDRKPVHVFPKGWVNKLKHPYSWHPSVVYNKGLGIYMMSNWGVGTDTSTMWFTKPTYLGIYTSITPWGPWKQIYEDKAWIPPGGDPEGQCYQPQIMPGWIAPDGRSFWLAWTQYPKGYYFQVQRVDIVTDNKVNDNTVELPEMIKVNGGSFVMGDQQGRGEPDERPARKITVSGFSMSKTEITVAQWKIFCKATNHKMPPEPAWGWRDDHPIVHITGLEADEYCIWLSAKTGKNIRLPTEAEWEFAARGGNNSKDFMYSGSNQAQDVAWSAENSNGTTQPVAKKQPNEIGLHDMTGNAWEWCSDWLSEYDPGELNDPKGPKEGTFRVRRGGSWDVNPKYCRNSYRLSNSPKRSFHSIGLRIVY